MRYVAEETMLYFVTGMDTAKVLHWSRKFNTAKVKKYLAPTAKRLGDRDIEDSALPIDEIAVSIARVEEASLRTRKMYRSGAYPDPDEKTPEMVKFPPQSVIISDDVEITAVGTIFVASEPIPTATAPRQGLENASPYTYTALGRTVSSVPRNTCAVEDNEIWSSL